MHTVLCPSPWPDWERAIEGVARELIDDHGGADPDLLGVLEAGLRGLCRAARPGLMNLAGRVESRIYAHMTETRDEGELDDVGRPLLGPPAPAGFPHARYQGLIAAGDDPAAADAVGVVYATPADLERAGAAHPSLARGLGPKLALVLNEARDDLTELVADHPGLPMLVLPGPLGMTGLQAVEALTASWVRRCVERGAAVRLVLPVHLGDTTLFTNIVHEIDLLGLSVMSWTVPGVVVSRADHAARDFRDQLAELIDEEHPERLHFFFTETSPAEARALVDYVKRVDPGLFLTFSFHPPRRG